MNILQHVIFSGDFTDSKKTGLYFNASKDVHWVGDVLIVPPYQKVDFDTYFNYFSVKKWVSFGQIDSLYVRGNIKGVALLEVIGVKKYQNRTEQSLISKSKIGMIGEWSDYHQDVQYFEHYDAIFVRVCTLNEQCELGILEFGTHKPIRQPIKLLIGAFGDNNPKVLDDIGRMAYRNGLQVGFFRDTVLESKDGQIGSIIHCLKESLAFDTTHILTLSADNYIGSEAVFRAARFFEMVFLERRDVLMVGHSLSLPDDQKEIPNLLEAVLQGGSKNNTLDWSFCMFDKEIIQGYGLPLPLSEKYSAREYQKRIHKEIVPMNGVAFHCTKKDDKSIMQTEYYEVRDAIIDELLNTKPKLSKIKSVIWDRFWHNIHTYQYVGARLNLYALDHIIKGTYWHDESDIERYLHNLYRRENKFTKYTRVDLQNQILANTNAKKTLIGKMKPYFGVGGHSVIVGERRPSDFWGKKTVLVANAGGEAQVARIRRKKAANLIAHATKSYYHFAKNHKQIKQSLLQYRNEKK